MRNHSPLPHVRFRAPAARPGVTLTEVLISLLILSVGVVSVFSLYPVSLLRSIRATQATNAKIASSNALDRVQSDDRLINGVPLWRPGATYVVGDVVAVPKLDGSLIARDATRWVCAGGSDRNGDGLFQSGFTVPPFETFNPAAPTTIADVRLPASGSLPAEGVVWAFASEIAADPGNAGDGNLFIPGANYGGIADARSLAGDVYCVDPRGWTRLHELIVLGSSLSTHQLRDGYGTAPRLDGGLRTLISNVPGPGWGTRDLSQWDAELATINSAYATRYDAASDGSPLAFDGGEPTAGQVRLMADELATRSDAFTPAIEPYEPLPGTGPTAEATYDPALGAFTEFKLPPGQPVRDLISLAADLEAAGIYDGVVLSVASKVTGQGVTVPISAAALDPANNSVSAIVTPAPADFLASYRGLGGRGSGTAAEASALFPLQVSVSVKEAQYSWLYTMRRTRDGLEGDVVTFFRRSVSAETEAGYAAWFGNSPTTTDDDLFVAGGGTWTANAGYNDTLAGTNRRRAWIADGRDYNGDGVADAVAEIAVGRRVFDSVGGHWYEVEAVVTRYADVGAAGQFIVEVELDRPVEVTTSLQDPTGLPAAALLPAPSTVLPLGAAGPSNYPQAVVPRGVVSVRPFSFGREGDGT